MSTTTWNPHPAGPVWLCHYAVLGARCFCCLGPCFRLATSRVDNRCGSVRSLSPPHAPARRHDPEHRDLGRLLRVSATHTSAAQRMLRGSVAEPSTMKHLAGSRKKTRRGGHLRSGTLKHAESERIAQACCSSRRVSRPPKEGPSCAHTRDLCSCDEAYKKNHKTAGP